MSAVGLTPRVDADEPTPRAYALDALSGVLPREFVRVGEGERESPGARVRVPHQLEQSNGLVVQPRQRGRRG